jgi:hypothetical protein
MDGCHVGTCISNPPIYMKFKAFAFESYRGILPIRHLLWAFISYDFKNLQFEIFRKLSGEVLDYSSYVSDRLDFTFYFN